MNKIIMDTERKEVHVEGISVRSNESINKTYISYEKQNEKQEKSRKKEYH